MKCVRLLLIAVFVLGLPNIAMAQDEPEDPPTITSLNEGDPAPFAGTLFSVSAAAQLLIDLEYSEETCNLEIERRIRLVESEYILEIDTVQAELDALRSLHIDLIEIKDGQIDYLQNHIRSQDRWYNSRTLWVVIGVLAGVGITVASGYALSQVN